MKGLVHIYCGEGKGKTTAAVGLALRAAGAGKRVIFAQFLKDGSSSEIEVLKKIENITVRHCRTVTGWVKNMTGEERAQAKADYGRFLEELLREAKEESCGLLVLDEAFAACNCGFIEEKAILSFLDTKPEALELVLTGRNPSPELMARADYITEMKKIKHPYDRGIAARKGVEY
ncbi:MAG: cob(I)yrinic acid a,c-diamide adenosyltransferase [Lachnospiraceae bacterium]|nr:cob(I)yrinic acid a,c-diamide adenosyltransferase [Lachnospiraceae bacterium]